LEFVIRRRVPISIALFGSLVIEDLATGVVPHDILDFTDPKAMFGLLAILAGLALRSWAAGFLVKDTQLTTTGPYAIVRNPLYLGSFLMVGGFCLLIDDPENIWVLPVALLVIYWPKVRREEGGLAVKFPEAWTDYSASTARFVPRLSQRPRFAGWLLSQWKRSREYNAVVATTAALVGLKLVRLIHLS
jgi:protein-S-isoprenylcysteine O-methyltransferase Ste14